MTSWLRPGLRLPLTSRHAFSLHRNARVNHVPIFASTLCAGSTRAYTSPSLSTAAGAHSQPGMAGIAFDIDGVLKLGSKVIEGAPEAVQRITPKHLGGRQGELAEPCLDLLICAGRGVGTCEMC